MRELKRFFSYIGEYKVPYWTILIMTLLTSAMTEDLIKETGISLEDMVIRQIEIEILQKAMQSLTEVQKERLHLYFFKGMTTREIADKLGVSQNVVWKSIRGSINTLKKFFE